jgi:hypothetical protein
MGSVQEYQVLHIRIRRRAESSKMGGINMIRFQLTRSGDQFIAEFDDCREIADTPIEAIEKAHRAAIKKRTEERIQKAFERPEMFFN